MKEIARSIGTVFETAKCHDFFHIAHDVGEFGAMASCDTGKVLGTFYYFCTYSGISDLNLMLIAPL
jgi:hypothetical protein